eukprot:gnl/TRDRNA2_/TRDRNA2_79104_c1_seq1.p1 gnl/TRDRNA2_/TRDRNA2_79104_c1~~gnl/TRDRNA2_/TRDRNA2_79104_c1_seq1.p1  ORF type:complete len:115 (-),score=5.08 gnl/TRDRNA2_/TRDRNA2_79104_c1_seq1:276-620(-)
MLCSGCMSLISFWVFGGLRELGQQFVLHAGRKENLMSVQALRGSHDGFTTVVLSEHQRLVPTRAAPCTALLLTESCIENTELNIAGSSHDMVISGGSSRVDMQMIPNPFRSASW